MDAPPRPAWRRWLPFLIGAALIACVNPATPWAALFTWVGRQPFGDKIAHFLLIGTAAFLLDHALAGRLVRLGRVRVRLAMLIVAVVMTAEEVSQLWIPGRSFELADLAANYAGIATAALVAWWRSRIAPRPLASRPRRS